MEHIYLLITTITGGGDCGDQTTTTYSNYHNQNAAEISSRSPLDYFYKSIFTFSFGLLFAYSVDRLLLTDDFCY